MVYVTMTDNYLTNLKGSKGKINKLIFECSNMNEANIVKENAANRSDMRYINITLKKPYYTSTKYIPQTKNKDEYPRWYIKDFFKKKRI